MDHTWFEHFQAELQLEMDDLFKRIRDKKLHIQALIGAKFAEEAAYQHFVDQHEATLHGLHMRVATLQREIQSEKRKQQDDGGLITSLELNLPDDDSDPDISDEGVNDEDSGMDFSMFGAGIDPEPQADSLPTARSKQVERDSAKKWIADIFTWIYHPDIRGDGANDFFTNRSVQLNKMKDNKLLDGVDVMMRMPFEADDEQLWYESLPRTNKSGKSMESPGERWYRFRLWERMLAIGVTRAEAQNAAEPDMLYQHYEAMKQQGISILAYLENMKEDLQAQIGSLQQQLDDLRDNDQ